MKSFQLLITVAVFLICQSSSAQSKSYPGYYITNERDTVRGVFSKYTQWNKNPSNVEFAAEGARDKTYLTPENASKFVVEGYDEYVSYTGRRLVNPIADVLLLSGHSFSNLNDSLQQVTAFVRLLKRTTSGDFYILNDGSRINFFYQLPGQSLVELRYKKALIESELRETADFRQQLNNLFGQAIAEKHLTNALENLVYEEDELLSFLDRLFPATKQVRTRQHRNKAEWLVGVGASINSMKVDAEKSFNTVPRNYNSSFSPLISVGFIVPVGRNFGRYFFSPQLKFFRYKNTGEETQGSFINSITYQADLATAASLSGGMNIINQSNCRVFFAAGFGMLIQANPKQVRQWYAASTGAPYLSPEEIKLSTLTYSIDAAAGVEIKKKFRLSAAYMIPTNIANFVFYSPKLSAVQLQVAYKL